MDSYSSYGTRFPQNFLNIPSQSISWRSRPGWFQLRASPQSYPLFFRFP